MSQQYTYSGLGFFCVKILKRVQGTIGHDFRDRTSTGHMGTQRQSVGHLSSWNTAQLDTGGFTLCKEQDTFM